ncbi:hypothetical protein H0H81_005833, partial [Sphagnurus paluster]
MGVPVTRRSAGVSPALPIRQICDLSTTEDPVTKPNTSKPATHLHKQTTAAIEPIRPPTLGFQLRRSAEHAPCKTTPTTLTATQYKLEELTTAPEPPAKRTGKSTTPAHCTTAATKSSTPTTAAAISTTARVYSPSADQPVVAAPSRARLAAEALSTTVFAPTTDPAAATVLTNAPTHTTPACMTTSVAAVSITKSTPSLATPANSSIATASGRTDEPLEQARRTGNHCIDGQAHARNSNNRHHRSLANLTRHFDRHAYDANTLDTHSMGRPVQMTAALYKFTESAAVATVKGTAARTPAFAADEPTKPAWRMTPSKPAAVERANAAAFKPAACKFEPAPCTTAPTTPSTRTAPSAARTTLIIAPAPDVSAGEPCRLPPAESKTTPATPTKLNATSESTVTRATAAVATVGPLTRGFPLRTPTQPLPLASATLTAHASKPAHLTEENLVMAPTPVIPAAQCPIECATTAPPARTPAVSPVTPEAAATSTTIAAAFNTA